MPSRGRIPDAYAGACFAALATLAACNEERAIRREPTIESASAAPPVLVPSIAPSPEEIRLRRRAQIEERLESISALAEAIDLVRPEMSDQEIGFRPRLPMGGGRGRNLLEGWGRTHFRWQELAGGASVDVAAALKDVSAHRGERVCVEGRFDGPGARVLVSSAGAASYRHQIDATNVRNDSPAGTCKVCGVLIGRTFDIKEDGVDDVGLIIVGLVDPDAGRAP